MIRDVFTSKAATNAIAQRVRREASRHNMAVMDGIREALVPIYKEILQRGKLSRQRLLPAFNEMLLGIKSTKNLVWWENMVKRPSVHGLSTNESVGSRFVTMVTHPSNANDYIGFLGCELVLDRRSITLRVDSLDFAITSHVLARFMQRDQQGIPQFLGNLARAWSASVPLAVMNVTHGDGAGLALPHDRGLLLGNINIIPEDPEDERSMPLRITYDRDGKKTETLPIERANDKWRAVAEMRTFVDSDSLTNGKVEIARLLHRWEEDYREGISALAEGYIFGTTRIRRLGQEKVMAQAVEAACDATSALVQTPEWVRFAEKSRR